MTIEEARKLVLDPLYLGCLMIKNGSKTISNVPVQRNYRTNIFGSILTGAVDLGITIDPDFETPDHNYEELLLAAQNGGSVTLTEDITLTEEAPVIIDNGITLTVDLNGNTITRADGDNGQSGVWAFRVNNGTLILNDATGTGTIDGGEGLEHSMLWANGANAKIIINSGNYTVGGNPTGNNYKQLRFMAARSRTMTPPLGMTPMATPSWLQATLPSRSATTPLPTAPTRW